MKPANWTLVTFAVLAACTADETVLVQPVDLMCDPYHGTEQIIRYSSDHLIVFGEMHGTEESPEAIQQFVCAVLEQGLSVRLGLETGRAQSDALDSALGQPFERNLIKGAATEMWSIPDGRGTEAILDVLSQVSAWKSNKLDVSVFTYDGEPQDYENAENIAKVRDAVMAREIDRKLDGFDGVVVVLTGNLHARKSAFEFADQEFVPMASLITERPVLSLNMKYGPGEAWVNASIHNDDGSIEDRIGALTMSGNAGNDPSTRKFELDVSEQELFDGYYFTGPITASPPAFPDLLPDME